MTENGLEGRSKMKKLLIGYTTIEKDRVMHNNQFSYAASFEDLLVKAGKYPIYTYKDELRNYGDRIIVEGAYYGYTGTVVAGNVGRKPGEESRYDLYTQGYCLAEEFLKGYKYLGVSTIESDGMELLPEWGLYIADFNSERDGRRIFCLELIKKPGVELEDIEFERQINLEG